MPNFKKNVRIPRRNTTSACGSGRSDSPQVWMTWYEAAEYCNWLSDKEGIEPEQWIYRPNLDGKYAIGMNTRENAESYSVIVFRPEAEWEYACRAGTTTSRYYGSAEALLAHYVIHTQNGQNHTWPVGSRKPNDFGLFDTLGNVSEWCHGSYDLRERGSDSVVDDTLAVVDDNRRTYRGCAFGYLGMIVRVALRGYDDPSVAVDE